MYDPIVFDLEAQGPENGRLSWGGLSQGTPGFALGGHQVDGSPNRAHLLHELPCGEPEAFLGKPVSRYGEIGKCCHAHKGMDAHLGVSPVILGHEGHMERAVGVLELILRYLAGHALLENPKSAVLRA